MTPAERLELKRAKVAVGLTPAQADEVIAAQEAWDADPANPNYAKPAKSSKPGAAKDGKPPAGDTD